MSSLLWAVVAFGILIFFHELGHFLVAKAMGVRVLTFALGFGPKLLKANWRGTQYAVCAVPLGGYVKMMGEEPEEELPEEELVHSFSTQRIWRRFLIVVAGPFFNFFLAVLILWVFYTGEVPYITSRVQEVLEGYPAAEAGIQPGDLIVAVDGASIHRWQDVIERVTQSEGRPLRITLERGGVIHEATVVPKPRTVVSRYGDEIQLWQIGITSTGEVGTERFGVGEALVQACVWTWDKSWFTLRTLARLVAGKESLKNIGSPLLIGIEAGKQAQVGAASYFTFIAFISVILAVMNLLPIPILDGGHLLFFALEGLVRRPMDKRVRGAAQYVGMGILACIMAWAIYRDLDRLYYLKTKQGEPSAVESQRSTPSPKESP